MSIPLLSVQLLPSYPFLTAKVQRCALHIYPPIACVCTAPLCIIVHLCASLCTALLISQSAKLCTAYISTWIHTCCGYKRIQNSKYAHAESKFKICTCVVGRPKCKAVQFITKYCIIYCILYIILYIISAHVTIYRSEIMHRHLLYYWLNSETVDPCWFGFPKSSDPLFLIDSTGPLNTL